MNIQEGYGAELVLSFEENVCTLHQTEMLKIKAFFQDKHRKKIYNTCRSAIRDQFPTMFCLLKPIVLVIHLNQQSTIFCFFQLRVVIFLSALSYVCCLNLDGCLLNNLVLSSINGEREPDVPPISFAFLVALLHSMIELRSDIQ